MEKFKKFFTKSKYQDLGYIGILLLFFVGFAIYMGHIYGNLYMDCGREALLPKLMLEGKILYKDIFGMYNPLSYQINALLYLIFGSSLNTLYGAAYLNAFFIIVGMYFICRKFISGFYSFCIIFLIMSLYIFGSTSLMSYLYPYSFAFPYAVLGLTYSVLIFLIYMKNDDPKYAYFASLLLGFSIANKPEFVLCIMPITIVLSLKKNNVKHIIIVFSLFFLPTILSYGLLALQGFNFQDLLNYIEFSNKFFNTEEQILYTSTNIMANFSSQNFYTIFSNFVTFAMICFGICIYLSLFNKRLFAKIFGIVFSPLMLDYLHSALLKYNHINYFSWVIFGLIFILYMSCDKIKDNKDKMLLFLSSVGLLSMARINFIPISRFGMGIYMLLPILAVWIYFINIDIKLFKNVNYKVYLAISFIIIGLLNITVTKELTKSTTEIQTSKGNIIQSEIEVKMFEDLTDWINKNTKNDESVLIIPEGVMLNFVTDRPTKPMYYHLIPNHISTLGEDNIVAGLNNNKADYIIINNAKYPMYGKNEICEDFGLKICAFVDKNYNKVKEFNIFEFGGEPFTARIYKLKND